MTCFTFISFLPFQSLPLFKTHLPVHVSPDNPHQYILVTVHCRWWNNTITCPLSKIKRSSFLSQILYEQILPVEWLAEFKTPNFPFVLRNLSFTCQEIWLIWSVSPSSLESGVWTCVHSSSSLSDLWETSSYLSFLPSAIWAWNKHSEFLTVFKKTNRKLWRWCAVSFYTFLEDAGVLWAVRSGDWGVIHFSIMSSARQFPHVLFSYYSLSLFS